MTSGLLAGAAFVLLVAGALKVADPSRTAGALAALGWPSSPGLVRGGAAAEVALAAATLVVGGPALAMLVAATYLGFAWFVMAALRAGTPLATCGCLGQVDTPPSGTHVIVDGLLATGAVVAAATDAPALLASSWPAWLVAAAVALAATALLGSAVSRSRPPRHPSRPTGRPRPSPP